MTEEATLPPEDAAKIEDALIQALQLATLYDNAAGVFARNVMRALEMMDPRLIKPPEERVRATLIVEGNPEYMRSTGPEADRCVCCKGAHVFGVNLDLEGAPDFHGRPETGIASILNSFLMQKTGDGRLRWEGKRVRVRFDIMDQDG